MDESFQPPQNHKKRRHAVCVGFAVVFAAIAGLTLTSSKNSQFEEGRRFLKSKNKKSNSKNYFEATITASNEYGVATYGQEYPWLRGKVVVEPFKYTTLDLAYSAPTFGSKLMFTWKVTPPSESDPVTFEGSRITNAFTSLGSHSIEVVAKSQSGEKIGTYMTTAHCLYVKREIRTLTEEDRENFLDAMYKMWEVGTKAGRQMYGSEFTGMDRFTSVHADQATGDIMCDKWHEGSGFLTHHLALATSFEISLRAVDARVTTPYWDFTIEGEKLYRLGKGPKAIVEISDVFSDTWFGSTDSLSHVQDSRWAHSPALMAVKPGSVQNSYGIIRAPWNNAKDRELLRHMSDVCGLEPVNKPIPTCKTHFKVMNLTSLGPFLIQIAGYGHGPMHVNTGGVFGECTGKMSQFYESYPDEMNQVFTMKGISDRLLSEQGIDRGWALENEFTFKMMIERFVHLEYFHIYRTLWRSQTCAVDGLAGAMTCPDSCDSDTPETDCKCTCPGIDLENGSPNFDWQNFEPCMYASDTAQEILQLLMPEEMRKDLVTLMCSTGVKEGEQLESASPGDPLFWMIHPIIDRMLVAKRLAKENVMEFGSFGRFKGFKDEDWLDYSFYSSSDYTCEGHGMEDDVLSNLPLPDHLIHAADVNDDGVLSNIEFYDAMDPLNGDGITYIYDHFKWDHCDVTDYQGEDVDPLATTTTMATDDDAGYTFVGGVNPSMWDGESYDSLLPDKIKKSGSLSSHRAAAAAGLKPGKSLKPSPKNPGSKEDFDAVMSILKANYGSKSVSSPVRLESDGSGGQRVVDVAWSNIRQ